MQRRRQPVTASTMSTFIRGVSPKLASRISPKYHTSSRCLSTKATLVRRSPVQSGLYATAFLLSTGLFAVYYFDARSALHRYFLTPLLRHTLDAETGHKIAVKVLKSGLGPKDPLLDDQRLELKVSINRLHRCFTLNFPPVMGTGHL
jgi:hypothetical protein